MLLNVRRRRRAWDFGCIGNRLGLSIVNSYGSNFELLPPKYPYIYCHRLDINIATRLREKRMIT